MEMVDSPWSCRRPRWRVTVQGEARARTLNVYGGGRRGGRGRGPGLVLVLVLWRLLLQLVILWWGEALLGGNMADMGTGVAQVGTSTSRWHGTRALAKPNPLLAPHGVNKAESDWGGRDSLLSQGSPESRIGT